MSGKQKGTNIVMVITIILSIATIACGGIILFYVGYGTNDKEYSIEEIVGIYDSHTEEIYYDDQYNKLIEEKRLVIYINDYGECVGTVTVTRRGYGKYYEQSRSERIAYQGKVVLSKEHISIDEHIGCVKTKTIEATETGNKKRIRKITIEGVTYRNVIY
ncbi:MAG: hypothetical protein ACI4M5_00010 [Christensenellales bacterium]